MYKIYNAYDAIEIVEIQPGDELVITGNLSNMGLGGRIIIKSQRGIVAVIDALYTETPRGTNTYYDRHRIAKGDCFDGDTAYTVLGNFDSVLNMILVQLPKCFEDSGFKKPRQFQDDYERFDCARTLFCGGGYYGNTPKKSVQAIKRFWKKDTKFIAQ